MTFDTLAFCKRLQDGGVPSDQAEAHARAQADFLADYLLSEMTTKKDLERFATKKDLERFATKEDLIELEKRMATKQDLELLGKTITIRLGGIVVLGIGVLAALSRF